MKEDPVQPGEADGFGQLHEVVAHMIYGFALHSVKMLKQMLAKRSQMKQPPHINPPGVTHRCLIAARAVRQFNNYSSYAARFLFAKHLLY